MTSGLLICIWLNICAFPHILGSPSSYMTLQPIPSEFSYIWGKFSFFFISGRFSILFMILPMRLCRPWWWAQTSRCSLARGHVPLSYCVYTTSPCSGCCSCLCVKGEREFFKTWHPVDTAATCLHECVCHLIRAAIFSLSGPAEQSHLHQEAEPANGEWEGQRKGSWWAGASIWIKPPR